MSGITYTIEQLLADPQPDPFIARVADLSLQEVCVDLVDNPDSRMFEAEITLSYYGPTNDRTDVNSRFSGCRISMVPEVTHPADPKPIVQVAMDSNPAYLVLQRRFARLPRHRGVFRLEMVRRSAEKSPGAYRSFYFNTNTIMGLGAWIQLIEDVAANGFYFVEERNLIFGSRDFVTKCMVIWNQEGWVDWRAHTTSSEVAEEATDLPFNAIIGIASSKITERHRFWTLFYGRFSKAPGSSMVGNDYTLLLPRGA